MPFIRVTRDKRGYEATLVMHSYRPATGAQRGRVLYLFRTPTNVHVGRQALEPEVMEALEHTHPDLNFDWSALQRDPASRAGWGEEEGRPVASRQPPRPAGGPAPTVPQIVVEDQTVLGRALGAERAARLRSQYADLLQRINRRARTPEDRDRLTERAARLNPDGWTDEAAVQTAVVSVETEWLAIASELPRRRRGRRGGRHAHDGRTRVAGEAPRSPEADAVSSTEVDSASVIMTESEEGDDAVEHLHSLDRADVLGDDRRDGGSRGSEPDADAATESEQPPDGFSSDR